MKQQYRKIIVHYAQRQQISVNQVIMETKSPENTHFVFALILNELTNTICYVRLSKENGSEEGHSQHFLHHYRLGFIYSSHLSPTV